LYLAPSGADTEFPIAGRRSDFNGERRTTASSELAEHGV
jgi:hypothetical protein